MDLVIKDILFISSVKKKLIVCLSMYSLFCYYFKCRGVRRISCLTFCEFRKNDSTKEKEKAIVRSVEVLNVITVLNVIKS